MNIHFIYYISPVTVPNYVYSLWLQVIDLSFITKILGLIFTNDLRNMNSLEA